MNKHLMPRASLAAMAAARPAAVLGSVLAEANPGKIEQLLADVKQELTRVGDEVKRTAENALKESKDAGTLSAEVKATADKLLLDQGKLTNAHEKLENRLQELTDRNLDLEQRLSGQRSGGRDAPKSLGQQVAESDALKAFASGGGRGSVTVQVKNAITSAGGSAGSLIQPQRDTEIVGIPRRRLLIRQLLDDGTDEQCCRGRRDHAEARVQLCLGRG
jgi:HK97 family phage major capsid protein